MRTQYNPNIEITEFIFTAEEIKDNDISIRIDERAKVIKKIDSFFEDEMSKLVTDSDDGGIYYRDSHKANEILNMHKRLCRIIKGLEEV